MASPSEVGAPSAQAPPRMGIVKQILFDGSVVIRGQPRGGPPPERQFSLSYVVVPRLGRRPTEAAPTETKDEPYAWEAREYMRKILLGKQVQFKLEYTIPNTGREFGSLLVKIDGNMYNVADKLISEGLAELRPAKVKDERYKYLSELAAAAVSARKGKWSNDDPANHIRKIIWNVDNPREFANAHKGKPLNAIVEYVRDGSTVRAVVLPTYTPITVMMSGIRSPTFNLGEGGSVGTAEPYAEEAKYFTECRLLQQDVEILIESVSNQSFLGTILHPNGDIAEALLREGFARCVDWSIGLVTGGSERLRAAERLKGEGTQTSTVEVVRGSGCFSGRLQSLPGEGDGDCSRRRNDCEKARRFLSKNMAIFRAITEVGGFKLDKDQSEWQPASPSSAAVRYTVSVPSQGVSSAQVGWQVGAIHRRLRPGGGRPTSPARLLHGDDQRPVGDGSPTATSGQTPIWRSIAGTLGKCSLPKVWRPSFATGKATRIGPPTTTNCWLPNSRRRRTAWAFTAPSPTATCKTRPAARLTSSLCAFRSCKGYDQPVCVSFRFSKGSLAQNASKSKQFLPFLQRAGRSVGIVEFIAAGSRLRIYVPKESCLLTLLLGGINCPRPARPGVSGGLEVPGEPLSAEALQFTKDKCFQKEVEFEVDSVDKAGNFIGSCFIGGKNLAEMLLEEGLGSVHFAADRSKHGNALRAAEKTAKEDGRGVWSLPDYQQLDADEKDDEDEQKEATNFGILPERVPDYRPVLVTDIQLNLQFFVQYFDQGEVLEKMMKDLRADMAVAVSSSNSYEPRKGQLCAALFSCDKQWYRARVENIREADQFDVIYIDFGNRETRNASQLAALPPAYANHPPGAKECALALVKLPPDAEYCVLARRHFDELVKNEQCMLNVEYRDGALDYVTLMHDDTDVGKSLLRNGYCNVDLRRDRRMQSLLVEYQQAEMQAKKERLNVWQYGDFTGTDL